MGVEYRISQATISRNLKWKGEEELLCYRCGEKISIGDWIHRCHNYTALKARSKDARFYHLRCWEDLFVSA